LRSAAVLALALVLVGGGLASARPRTKPKGGPETEVFARGTRLFKERDFLGALEAFSEAYKLAPHFLLQCNIARCQERLSDMVRAAEHYRRCLAEGAEKTPGGAKVKAALALVEARISRVLVQSPGAGGTVYVDGKSRGEAPQRLALNPGDRVIEVRRPGATTASTTLSARGGEQQTLTLVPTEPTVSRPAPPPPATQPTPPPPPRKRVHQAWFWTMASLTVGLGVASGLVGWRALSARDDYVVSPTRDGYNSARDLRLVTNLLWGAAVATGITATTLGFFTDFRRSPRTSGEETALSLGLRGTF